MLAYMTPFQPGIHGFIKARPEDFFVEEQPLFPPAGSGEHLWLYIEKRRRSTTDVTRRLAKLFRVGRSEISYAGLKDKYAVTRQMLSVELPNTRNDADLIQRVRYTGVRVLWASRHHEKIHRGELRGNRFVIRVRGARSGAAVDAQRIMDLLVKQGAPNYFGQQRFGYRTNNHRLGKLLLLGQWRELLDLMLGDPRPTDHPVMRAAREAYERGDYVSALAHWPRHVRHDRQAIDGLRQGRTDQEAVMAIDRQQRGFLICGLQSVIFNRILNQRLRDGLFDRLIDGDLAWRHEDRSIFGVTPAIAAEENEPNSRVKKLEISPSGPMWGVSMPRAKRVVGQWEHHMLTQEGLTETDLIGGPQAMAEGKRRPFRAIVTDSDIREGQDDRGPYLQASFQLPPGAYATVVMREIMKPVPTAWEMLDGSQLQHTRLSYTSA